MAKLGVWIKKVLRVLGQTLLSPAIYHRKIRAAAEKPGRDRCGPANKGEGGR